MAMLSSLLVRIGVDDSRVGRAVRRTEQRFSRLGESTRNFARRMGQSGLEMGRNFTSSVVEGMKSLGPKIGLVVYAAFALLPTLGAFAATALVLAFGAAFAAIGLAATVGNKGVQKEITSLKKHVGKELKEISKPFVSTWQTILKTARSVFDKLAPELGKAFKHIAPALSSLTKDLGEGLKQLAPAIEPLGKTFSTLMTQIGPSLPGIFKSISDSLISMSNTINENPELFAGFVTGMLQTVMYGFKLIDWLAQAFVWMSKFMGTTNALVTILGFLIPPLAILMAAFRKVKEGLSDLDISWSSIWNRIKTVALNVWNSIVQFLHNGMAKAKAAISNGMASAKATLLNAWNSMKNAASNGVSRVVAAVRTLPGRIRSALGNLGGLLYGAGQRVIQGLINGINSMIGRVAGAIGRVASTIRNHLPFSPAKEGPLSGRGSPERSGMQIARMISHGMLLGTGRVSNAANAIAGAAAVSPSGVRSAGRNGNGLALTINSGGSRMDDLLVEALRSAIRDRGGNVQAVLGQ